MKLKDITERNGKLHLLIVNPIYKTKKSIKKVDGVKEVMETQVLAREIAVSKWINKDGITSVDDYVNINNTISKSRSIIYDKYSSRFFATFHAVDDIMKVLERTTNTIGF